ncbi:MAG: type III-B CRISPR module RAMP protein Cmr4 [Gammaproteobacteria bacterium]
MKPQARLITLQAITFLHPGTGQTTGVVDQPIQREVHTGYPMFAASGFKGSLRDKAERLWDKNEVETVFGSTVNGVEKGAGAFSITDARILAFPVRSLQQVFVWVTCPMVIQRLLRDIELIGYQKPTLALDDALALMETQALAATGSPLKDMLILEDVNFNVTPNNKTADAVVELLTPLLDEKAGFDGKRLVVIPDTDFQHLVRHATQVSARNKLNDESKTSDNLWYEETLPPETLMYALALCHDPRKKDSTETAQDIAGKLETLLADRFLQIGGNETVGQGWCCVKVNGDQS